MNDLVPIAPVSNTVLANFARYTEQAKGALSANTERAIRAATAVFTAWCSKRRLPALPAEPATVADFVDAMAA